LCEIHGQVLHGPLHVLVEESGAKDEQGRVPQHLMQLLVHGADLVPAHDGLDHGEDGLPCGSRGDHDVGCVAGERGRGQEPHPVTQLLLVHQAAVDPGIPLQDEVPRGLPTAADNSVPWQELGSHANVRRGVQFAAFHRHLPWYQQAFLHPRFTRSWELCSPKKSTKVKR